MESSDFKQKRKLISLLRNNLAPGFWSQSFLLLVAILFIIVGISLLTYPWVTDLQYSAFQNNVPASIVSTKSKLGQPMPNGAIMNLVIPKIHLDTYVFHGTDKATLKKGPGHYEETPLPGKEGNVAIAGHRTLYGHPFRNLDKLRKGDKIIVYTKKKMFVYRVIKKHYVSPKQVSVVFPTTDNRLTLTTCTPVGRATNRLVIVALQGNQ